jgi:membrane protein
MRARLDHGWRYLRFVGKEYQRDRCAQAAASLAFGTLLSLVPLVALLAWLTRPFHTNLPDALDALSRLFTPTDKLREAVQVAVQRYAENAAALGLIGLIFFLFVAFGMLSAIESTINDIWRVERRRGRIHRLARFWASMILVPLLFLASATLNQALERALILGGLMEKPIAGWLLADALPFMLLVASVSIAYQVLPHTRVRVKSAIIGGIVAGILYQIVRFAFAWYVSAFATYDRIYGILGVIPAFLAWLFLVWSVMIIGAEVAFSMQYPWDEDLPP